MKNRKLYIIAYDIREGKTRTAALKLCRSFATGGQKSLHECWLSTTEHEQLVSSLASIIDDSCDRLMSLSYDARQPIYTLGMAVEPLNPQLLLVS